MAGSSITNPRKSGSLPRLAGYKQIQNVAGTGGVGQGSGAPLPRTGQPAPGMLRGTSSPVAPTAQERQQTNARNVQMYQQNKREGELRGSMVKRSPTEFGTAVYTPDAPVYGTGAPAAPIVNTNTNTTGSGMVRAQGEQRGGDRTGVEVIGAGGTPIRVDRNQEIAGAATQEQAQNIRTVDKNSIMYNQYKDPTEITSASQRLASKWNELSRAAIDPNATPEQRQKASEDLRSLEEDMKFYGEQTAESAAGLAKEKGVYEPGFNQYRGEVDAENKRRADAAVDAAAKQQQKTTGVNNAGTAKQKLNELMSATTSTHSPMNPYGNVKDPNLVNRRSNEINQLLPTIGDNSSRSAELRSDVSRMLSEIADSDDPNLIARRYNSISEALDELGGLTGSGASSEIATSSRGLTGTTAPKPVDLSGGQQPTAQTAPVAGQAPAATATTPPGQIDPVKGLTPEREAAVTVPGRDQSGDPRYNQNINGMTANDVAQAFNIPPDQALFYLNKGVRFNPDGKSMVMPGSGQTYNGSELMDALSRYPGDPENAKEGRAYFAEWDAAVQKERTDGINNANAATKAAKAALVEQELNKPLDLSALAKGFDRQLEAQRQSAARNKALALRGIQERGAYSGASVNQMMGASTEAGYGYDTEAQAQEAALNLQKEMEIVKATKEDASRKLNWAVMLYNDAKTDEDRAKYWAIKQQQDEVLRQQQIYEANLAAQANSPSLGMTLAKVGIGVGGAVLAPFTGGSSLLVAGALGAGLQGAQSAGMFGGSEGAYGAYKQYAPGTQPAPSSQDFIYKSGPPPGQSYDYFANNRGNNYS